MSRVRPQSLAHSRPRLQLWLLLTLPLAWLVIVYLGSLAILLLNAFWTSDAFTGRVNPFDWSLDAFEQTLYNGYLSGVSIRGNTFFYQNPLESTGRAERSAYFDVACCPANLARLMARLPELVYAQRDNEIFVNLYAETKATVTLPRGQVQIDQATRYPWDGKISIALQMATPMEFTLRLRAPGWLDDAPFASDLYRFSTRTDDEPIGLVISGRRAQAQADRGWITLTRQWMSGDRVELTLPMPARRVFAHDRDMIQLIMERKPDELVAAMSWQQNPTRWCSIGNLVAALKVIEPTSVDLYNFAASMDEQGTTLVSNVGMALNK